MNRNFLALNKSCLYCGRIPLGGNEYYCFKCWGRIVEIAIGVEIEVQSLPMTALFSWDQASEHQIRILLSSLKEGKRSRLAGYLADFWIQRWLTKINPELKPVLVPAPPKRSGVQDHAWQLASALSHRLPNSSVLEALNRATARTDQKRLSIEERRGILMQKALDLPTGRPIVFVDDVVTTGATAVAAYKALGQPKSFQVWALTYRCRLPRGR